MLPLPWSRIVRWALAAALAVAGVHALAAPLLAFDRTPYDREQLVLDLRGHLEYRIQPAGTLDPQAVWDAPASEFSPGSPGQMLDLQDGSMMVLRIELEVQQIRDPDYLQLRSARLDRVRFWARAGAQPWQTGESGDRVPIGQWPFKGPMPAFELPDADQRIQIVLAVEQRGLVNVPIQWVPDHVFRAQRLDHAFEFGMVLGLALALALVCALALALFRKREFAALCIYTLMTAVFVATTSGYAAIYLWPGLPQWNDPSKPFVSMLLSCMLAPVMAMVLHAHVHNRAWWVGAWRWGVAGLVLAVAQAYLVPPQWRLLAGSTYVVASLVFAAMLAMHGVLRSDSMSAWALVAAGLVALSTLLGYADYASLPATLALDLAAAGLRLGFVVLMFCVAVQRHRYGRYVLSRAMDSGQRDALTGLFTRPGFEQALARSTLMTQHASVLPVAFIICDLRSLGTVRADLGEDLCERVLVRFAAILQRSLPGDSIIGRVGYARFAAVLVHDLEVPDVEAVATKVLTQALAQPGLPDFVRVLKLRMVLARQPLLRTSLTQLEPRCSSAMSAGDPQRVIRWL
jgi:GGDEF domain-containing protein